ncbi:hypothetical protein BLX87_05605 [Bacillus sp. VT-16-64]|nr:hypothetical protein BLX87_05605 [Bacillus sp. VT-16-64]
MDHKPVTKKPLLFINQPKMKEPLGQMQSSFTFSPEKPVQIPDSTQVEKHPVQKTDERDSVQENKRNRKRISVEEQSLIFDEPVKEVPKQPESSVNQQPSKGLQPVKSFPSMTIDEKLDYIFSSPQFYYCAFKTKDSEFVGKIKELHQDNILIMTTKGIRQTIERQDLVAIRIIG